MDVTVVVPALRAERFLAHTLESALGQTVPVAEVRVIDDSPDDATRRVAERYAPRVVWMRGPARGLAAARNAGADGVTSEWLAFLDSDDVWQPGKLESQRRAAEGHDAVLTAVTVVDEDLSPVADHRNTASRLDLEALLFHRDDVVAATSSTLLLRRSLFEALGGYDEALSYAADWDFLIRLRLRTEIAWVAAPQVLYRRHGAAMSRNLPMLERENVRVLEKAFGSPDLPAGARRWRRRCLAWNDAVLAGSHFWHGSRLRAVGLGARAVLRDPRLLGRVAGFPLRYLGRRSSGAPQPRGA